ncbi:MAG: hypothetical protein H0T15_09750, partial [Thermoleophilaceae bacterium]|nr:hypothetical protein [Thermoleophilaceae bacterium]
SLGVGPEETDLLVAVRQGVDEGTTAHEPTVEGMIEAFGTDAPDGVRLVVASRIDNIKPGCPCCGVSPEQLLGELEENGRIVICDMEAGVGAVVRAGKADTVLVVSEPTTKSIEVARRAAEAAAGNADVIVVANRVRDDADLDAIRAVLGEHEIVVVPIEPAIARADEQGLAPIDVDPDAPGVMRIVELADRLAGAPQPA